MEVFVARAADLAEGGRVVIAVEGVEIGVFRVAGELFAWRNECPHQGGPVCQGRLMKGVEERLDADRRSLGIHYAEGRLNLACPWHGWEFDLRNGCHAGLASVRLAGVAVRERDGGIYVDAGR